MSIVLTLASQKAFVKPTRITQDTNEKKALREMQKIQTLRARWL